MELLSYVRKIWLETHSKGTWKTKEGDEIPVELLTDSHLMRIPHFMWKNAKRDRRRTMNLWIPWAIICEIRERNMYIDYKNQCNVKYKEIKEVVNAPIINKPKKRNKIFFK